VDVVAERGQVVVELAPRAAGRHRRRAGTPSPSRADVTAYLAAELVAAPAGCVHTSLLELARATCCDLATVRVAVAALDPADHVVSVDVLTASPAARFWIEWAPVTAVIDLLLDWDLLTVDIAVAELSEWLGVSTEVTRRTVAWLGATAGVSVRRQALGGGTVRIAVAVDRCPLTAEVSSAAG
jgi:hypothetical protein